MTKKSSNKQFVAVLGGIAISLAIASLVLSTPLREIFAQETNSTQPNPMRMEIPQLNGSVSVQQQANQFIQDNVQVPFATALESAQAEAGNGTVISGRLGVVQGYLVYILKIANFDAETSRIVIVDAGNGAVLYTSGDMPLQFGGLGCGGGGGSSGYHHKGFGNHWGNHDRDGTSDKNSSQPSRSGIVVSPAIGV
ncbi:MAG: hypothetical protein M3275_11250 [Thermoproteota archaeon]|nr:hypothetical protein [Thermoproteota archaeon]